MKSTSSKRVALAITSAFVLSIGAATINAAENPFAIKSLAKGYQVADHHEKAKDGKCGEGKCGHGDKEMKADMKDSAKTGADMKDGTKADAKNSAKTDAKMKDGKCGEGKCGH